MSSDNGIVLNVQVKTFDGTQKIFGLFLIYLKALLMTKDLLDILFPELKNELPVSEKGQSKKEKANCSKSKNGYGLLWNNINFPKMND